MSSGERARPNAVGRIRFLGASMRDSSVGLERAVSSGLSRRAVVLHHLTLQQVSFLGGLESHPEEHRRRSRSHPLARHKETKTLRKQGWDIRRFRTSAAAHLGKSEPKSSPKPVGLSSAGGVMFLPSSTPSVPLNGIRW